MKQSEEFMRISVQFPWRTMLLLLFAYFPLANSLFSQTLSGPHSNWSDLESKESRVYGSEKENKFPINALIIEKEDWEDHYSFHAFWLYRNTDYPKYRSRAFLPFYYHLESKIDNRERTISFPFYVGQTDADTTFSLTPLTLLDDSSRDWFHLYGWLFLRRGDRSFTHTAFLPIVYFGSDERSNYSAVLPLYYYSRERSDKSASRSIITPVFYANGLESEHSSSSFSISPLHFHSFQNKVSTLNAKGKTGEQAQADSGHLGVPVLPFLYYSSWEGNRMHRRILTLLDWETSGDTLSQFDLYPIAFYGKNHLVVAPFYFRFGSETDRLTFGPGYYVADNALTADRMVGPVWWSNRKDESAGSLHVFPVYFSWEDRDPGNQTISFSISPIHIQNSETILGVSGRDQKSSVTETNGYIGFPVLPFLYYSSWSGAKHHHRVMTLLDWNSTDSELSRFYLFPLVFSGPEHLVVTPFYFRFGNENDRLTFGPGYYLADNALNADRLIGPAWWSNRKDGKADSLHVFPIYYSWKRFDEGKESSSFSVSPIHIQNSGKEQVYVKAEKGAPISQTVDTGFIGFPILPFLYYASWQGNDTHKKVLTLLDWTASETGVSQFYLFPLLFYGREYLTAAPFYFRFGKESDRVAFGPVYYFSDDSESSDRLIGPVWWSNQKDEKASSFHVAPLYFSWTKDSKGTDVTRFSPGLFYWSQEGSNEHLNVLGLVDLAFDPSGLDRSWIYPFVFTGKEYAHVLPFYVSTWTTNSKKEISESYKLGPIYYWHNSEISRERLVGPVWWSSNVDDTKSTFHVIPVSFAWSQKKDLEKSSLAINPLFFQLADYSGEKDNLEFYDLFWAPIVPLYFSNQTEIASRRHLLLANWSNDVTGLRQLWVMPFYFWREGKTAGYLHVPPFFFRPTGSNVAEGYSLGLTHYHSWSTAHDTLWLMLLYRDIRPEVQYFHVAPFYYSWHTQESTGQLALPLSFEYEDKTKGYSVNIAGVSRSRAAGIVDGNAGSKAGRWYLDTEISWLYNAFSLSARVSTPEREKQKGPTLEDLKDPGIRDIAEKEQTMELDLSVPRLSKKLTVSRDDTFYYWGFSVLYGAVSYQHADSRRHFRLLPFAWLSWDERSDDKVTIVPGAFLNYNSEETEYFALFPAFIPIYGKQRIGNSYVKAYGVFLGIDEYDDESKQSELSILWPLANFYSSPNQEGSRLLPVYWNRLTRSGDQVNKRTVSLAHYRSSSESPRVEESFWAAPLVVPLFLRSDTKEGTHESMWSTLLPFFYYSTDEDATKGQSRITFLSLPGIYHHRDATEKDGKKSENRTTFALGYYSSGTLDESNTSVLLGLYKSEQKPESSYTHLLWGLTASEQTSKESRRWAIPFYYSSETAEGNHTNSRFFLALPFILHSSRVAAATAQYNTNAMLLADWESNQDGLQRLWLLPVFAWRGDSNGYTYLFPYYSTRSGEESSTYFLPLYFAHSSPKDSTRFAAGLYLYSSETYSRENLLYLFDHEREGENNSHQALLGAFDYSTSDLGGPTRFSLLYHLLVSYRSQSSKSEMDLDYLAFFGGVETGKDYTHHRMLPFYWYDSKAENTLFLSPMVYYNVYRTEKQADNWTAFVAGLYLHSSETKSRQNLLYLLDHEREGERNAYRSLLGAIEYTSGPDVSRLELVYRLVADYRSERAEGKSERDLDLAFLFYLGGFQSRQDSSHHRLLPAYYYEKGAEDTLFLSPIAYYRSNHPAGGNGSKTAFISGLYLHSSPNYARQDFLLLFDHKRDLDTDYYQGLLGMAGIETRNDYLHHRFLPVYWYESAPQSTFLVSPIVYYNNDQAKNQFRADVPIGIPLVWHYSRTGQDVRQCALGCTAWFKDFDSQERSARSMLLGGIVYNEVQRPERGYRSRGSLWGLLWDYETEDNGFSKVSVLKFVYSRTSDVAGTRTRILGFAI